MKHFILCIFVLVPTGGYGSPKNEQSRSSLFSRAILQWYRGVRDTSPEKNTRSLEMSEQEVQEALDKLLQELSKDTTVTRADLLQYGCWVLYGCMQFCEGLALMFRMMHRGTEFMRTCSYYMPWE